MKDEAKLKKNEAELGLMPAGLGGGHALNKVMAGTAERDVSQSLMHFMYNTCIHIYTQ